MSEEEKKFPRIADRTFRDDLYEELKDPNYAIGYLRACNNEGEDCLRMALRNVAEVWKRPKDLGKDALWAVRGQHTLDSTCCLKGQLFSITHIGGIVYFTTKWFFGSDVESTEATMTKRDAIRSLEQAIEYLKNDVHGINAGTK